MSLQPSFDSVARSSAESSEDADANDDSSVFITRVASCVLRLGEDAPWMFTTPEARALADELQSRVTARLRADSRVTEVVEVPVHPVDNAATHTYWKIDPAKQELEDAAVPYQGLRLNQPSLFRVRIPIKNQPLYRNIQDVPSEEYLVLWDGVNVIVQWEQSKPRSTGSGGHAVLDLLTQAVKEAGYEVEVLACAPTCHHRFLHADFVSFSHGEHDHDFKITGEARIGVTVENPLGKRQSDEENIWTFYMYVQTPLAIYGQGRSTSNYIFFLEERIRQDAAISLQLAHERSRKSSVRHPVLWARDSWRLRGTSRHIRELMSGLWLALVTLDAQRGSWRHTHDRLVESLTASRMPGLSEPFDIGERQVQSQDVGLIRESIANLDARIEGRMLLWATAAGAVCAISGGLIAALIT